ncbi:MAG: DUF3667 domain-containing protein, partial [Bacteroidales bacterium]|nr:DUF3667 domain-containing protein [Bacteroidales bacterium]
MSRCLNCGTELSGEFCHRCGQRASVGRLTVKQALVDDAWSAVRMDRRVWPTIFALLWHPWVVIRDYIHGHRIGWTQPVRLIIILCFVNVVIQIFFPEEVGEIARHVCTDDESMLTRLWHAVIAFCEDSELTIAIVESLVVAPIFLVLFLPWGSRRFNLAEYSTAYLYLAAASLALDLVTLPLSRVFGEWVAYLGVPWWAYITVQMIRHSFPSLRGWKRVGMIIAAMVICGLACVYVNIFLQYFGKFLKFTRHKPQS